MITSTIFESKSIYVVPYILCVSQCCENKAVWGNPWKYEFNLLTGGTPLHCDAHKTDDEQYLIEKRCVSCKNKFIVDTNNICRKCKLAEYTKVNTTLYNHIIVPTSSTHPNFSIHPPPLKHTKSMYHHTNTTSELRSTKSSPDMLIGTIIATPKINLKDKLEKVQTQAKLQSAIKAAKANHAIARTTLAQYSLTENSASKAAAAEALARAEKEVEDACKAWCYASRS